jgi:molybdenum cofactor biosynthesis enzyme MoaA
VNVQRVAVTRLCNQNCAFCTERGPVEEVFQVRAALEAAGGAEVLLSGGEPTLRSDLPGIVAHAKKTASRVFIETNGALLDERRIAVLKRAGLDGARVHVPAWGDDCDKLTQDPGGFARTLAAIELLIQADLILELATPIVRQNRHLVARLPSQVAHLPVRALYLGVPVRAPDPTTLLPFTEAAQVVAEVGAAGRAAGVTVRVDPAAPIPPCLLPEPARLGHLFSLTRGGAQREDHAHAEACARCSVADRCPGLPRGVDAEVRPISDDRTRRRLSLISTVEAQIERELFQLEMHRFPDGSILPGGIVRVNFHCNQSCRFCFVSTHLPPPPERAVEEAIARVARDGGRLTLSGGEPTLNARLVEYVRLGKRLGAREVELQTNAVRLGDANLTRALAEGGVDVALVSLHAVDPETSDSITEAPGTFEKTLRGLDELAKTSIEVRLNFVLCERNWRQFAEFVDLVARRWPKASIVVSFVGPSTELVPRDRELIPRYEDVLPVLAEGIRRAEALGVKLHGFESMCGVPLCLVPRDLAGYFQLAEVRDEPGEFLKTEACHACSLEKRCWGLRRGYAELYGTGELRAVP